MKQALITLSAARALPGPCFGGTDRCVFGRPASCSSACEFLPGRKKCAGPAETMIKAMKHIRSGIVVFLFLILAPPAPGEDMRAVNREALQRERMMMEKARTELEQARREAEESRQRIMEDRDALRREIDRMEEENRRFRDRIAEQERLLDELREEDRTGEQLLMEQEAIFGEMIGMIRAGARDMDGLLARSPQTALDPDRGAFLAPLAEKAVFPGVEEIRRMMALLREETILSGSVRLIRGRFVNRSGVEVEGDILTVGNFSAAYRIDGEIGFLSYSDQDMKFHALNKPPPRRMRARIDAYMNGERADAPVDISGGGALRQLTHKLSLREQIPRGGPIVWPILLIPVLAVLIFVERGVYFLRGRLDMDGFGARFNAMLQREDWEGCARLCREHAYNPLANVLGAGIEFRHLDRADMENVLQEAILRHIPGQERFLAALGILASIAPLLGLLGTVTGMINTFHVITYLGSGDPRMMSGGISEALITTMLGLSAAIPIMLGHTLLNRHVEKNIAGMEEKAVTFVNAVYKHRQ